jgi:cbb3-type cytochrome oxidase subunit 3
MTWLVAHSNFADLALVVMLFGAIWIVWKAQKRTDFDFADMLRDDTTNKPTVLRFAIMGSFAVSSWIVMHDTLADNLSDQQFWAYLVIWSGAAVLRYIAERWNGQLPWSKHD